MTPELSESPMRLIDRSESDKQWNIEAFVGRVNR
jgi:hypothetical protein